MPVMSGDVFWEKKKKTNSTQSAGCFTLFHTVKGGGGEVSTTVKLNLEDILFPVRKRTFVLSYTGCSAHAVTLN